MNCHGVPWAGGKRGTGTAHPAGRASRTVSRGDTLRSQRDDLNGRLMGTAAQAATVAMPVKLAVDYESSMADVKKVTDFDDTGFKMFSQDLLEMSTRLPMTARGWLKLPAAAGAQASTRKNCSFFPRTPPGWASPLTSAQKKPGML